MPRNKGEQDTGAQSRARPEEKGDVERQREKLDEAERRKLKDALENERQRLTRK